MFIFKKIIMNSKKIVFKNYNNFKYLRAIKNQLDFYEPLFIL